MAAREEFPWSAPTPTPITDGRLIRLDSSRRFTAVAAASEACEGRTVPVAEPEDEPLSAPEEMQLSPTKPTVRPRAEERRVMTSPTGLAMVAELLPAKSKPTG